MSEIFGDILIRNLINLAFDDPFPEKNEKPMARRPSQSAVFPPNSKSISLSSERLSEDISAWPFEIRGENKPQFSFRPDRSLSLTENCLSKMKPLDVPPPPGFPPLSSLPPVPSNRYKTELCRSYHEIGACKYGSKCQFAHGEHELRCLHRHPKYKTEACRTFYNFGYCPYGSRCHFLHDEKLAAAAAHQKTQTHVCQNPRLLRQSVSFAGFLGTRSASPPSLYEPLSFSRAPSVSPPPADILSPVFNDSGAPRDMFPFCQSRSSEGDLHNIPLINEPQKPSHCVCGHGNNFTPSLNKSFAKEGSHSAFLSPPLQRFSSEDSLSDRESYSSTGSASGSESPVFDGSAGKRLTVFARMSVSD